MQRVAGNTAAHAEGASSMSYGDVDVFSPTSKKKLRHRSHDIVYDIVHDNVYDIVYDFLQKILPDI